MNPPEQLPEHRLVRARQIMNAVAREASAIDLRPRSAEIGITDDGETAIVMHFRIGPMVLS